MKDGGHVTRRKCLLGALIARVIFSLGSINLRTKSMLREHVIPNINDTTSLTSETSSIPEVEISSPDWRVGDCFSIFSVIS